MLVRVFLFALIVDAGFGQLVLEEALVVVPGRGLFLARPFRLDGGVARAAATLCGRVRLFAQLGLVRHQREVETLKRRRTFGGQLLADALLLLEAAYLVAAGAAVLLDKRLALGRKRRVVHVGGFGVVGSAVLREREEISGDVARVLLGETEVRHHRHVLHLKLRAVFGAARVLHGVEDEGEAVLRVVFGREVAVMLRAVRCPALARIVNPADGVVEALLLADARQVGGELAAELLVALADGVAGETSARLEQLLAVRPVAARLLRNLSVEGRLPEVSRNRFALVRLLRDRHDAAL